jgi:deoxyribodipyrimidine photolyase-related protein
LVEEDLFFNQYAFHKQKLVFHRASMQYHFGYLQKKGFTVNYIESNKSISAIGKLITSLKKNGFREIHSYRVSDNWLEKNINTSAKQNGISVIWHESPMFMLSYTDMKNEFSGAKTFFQTNFYIRQRKRFKILVNDELAPVGGKWSFDAENRKPYPKTKKPPAILKLKDSKFKKEAADHVEKYFSKNLGVIGDAINYPVTHEEAEKWLDDFIKQRLVEFGVYEDAMVSGEYLLNHSLLTPMLNSGLLTPKDVIDKVLDITKKQDIPMNSSEGFIRQVLGWREFMHGVYHAVGSDQRTKNYWRFKRKIPVSFYKGTTGIVPVDDAIQKLLKTGYNHHIERLMILSNFMLLCEFDPDEVYKWFMEMYIDAYDWVMVPNVYGMGQFADGGLICTKPYISGSNYILKMSNYKKDASWTTVWDALFWRFMHVHRDFFLKNPRLGMLVKTFDKMSLEKKQSHLQIAEKYLKSLNSNS